MNKSKNLDRGGYAGCTDWEPLKKAYSKKSIKLILNEEKTEEECYKALVDKYELMKPKEFKNKNKKGISNARL
tara:strand:+ start:53 stop:271 length:219 start_codon:yes stop_codon:yes gene_type:complete